MKATPFEFRFRLWIFLAIYVFGFLVPWDWALHLDGRGINSHVWGALAWLLAKSGAVSIGAAFNVVLVGGIVCALVGAWLRTWGAAYLGYSVVHDTSMRGDGVLRDGPFRYLRNPLYAGTWFNTLSLSLLIPPSGAIFTLMGVIFFSLRLILAEEAFLAAKVGAPYLNYCAQVPRLLPTLRPRVQPSGVQPHWLHAMTAEIYMWGSTVSFAVAGWRYNEMLLLRCVLVSLGVSLVVRALQPQELRQAS